MQVSPLSDICGVRVEGVDLAGPRSPDGDLALRRIFDEHGLVLFPGQALTKPQLVAAGDIFGGAMRERSAVATDPEAPGISVLSNRGYGGDIVPDDLEAVAAVAEWHTDQGYLTAPARGKMLYCVLAPEEGGMTGFIDGHATYDALPDRLKARLEGLHVTQSWLQNQAPNTDAARLRLKGEVLVNSRFPDTVYPIVQSHPVTGRKVLHFPKLWATGILEVPGEAGEALMAELLAHIYQPRFIYWHHYQPGDAIMWDNWRMAHAASGVKNRYPRTLWAMTLKPGPEFGRLLDSQAA